ncbi:MAG: type II secretion system F family protein [Acidithiobacillus sp.]
MAAGQQSRPFEPAIIKDEKGRGLYRLSERLAKLPEARAACRLPDSLRLRRRTRSFYPDLWLVDQAKRRGRLILKELPVYLDFITLMIEGGLNLTGAMQVAVDKGPPGPLRNEFSVMIRDLRAGTSKTDIFRRFGERVPLPEVRSLVSALIQSEDRGGDLGPALRAQAEQRREERFLRAEKMALEAPVKLLAPLLAFIFPITFLMLAFVIYMKFLQEGGF